MDRRERHRRQLEHGEQAADPVETEAHAELLTREQVALGVADVELNRRLQVLLVRSS